MRMSVWCGSKGVVLCVFGVHKCGMGMIAITFT